MEHEKNTPALLNQLLHEVKDLKTQISNITSLQNQQAQTIIKDAIYTNKQIRLLLGVDERLIKKYRDEGYLSFSRKGDKYWYTGQDVINFLNRNHYEAFA